MLLTNDITVIMARKFETRNSIAEFLIFQEGETSAHNNLVIPFHKPNSNYEIL